MTGLLAALERVSLAAPPVARQRGILAALDAVMPPPKRAGVSIAEPAEPRDEPPLRGPALRAALLRLRDVEPDRAPWPEEWWTRNDPADGVRCQRMWSECLRLSLIEVCDVCCKDFDLREAWDAKPAALRRGKRPDVRPSWIGSPDFHEVCALAGLDGEAVAQRARAQLVSREGAAAMGWALSAAVTGNGYKVRRSFGEGDHD
jgi:hypothetical protein